jgi:hypothetical protein
LPWVGELRLADGEQDLVDKLELDRAVGGRHLAGLADRLRELVLQRLLGRRAIGVRLAKRIGCLLLLAERVLGVGQLLLELRDPRIRLGCLRGRLFPARHEEETRHER